RTTRRPNRTQTKFLTFPIRRSDKYRGLLTTYRS
ncbi:putative sialic acid transporter, partial [Haemophilus influenzae]